MTLCDLLPVPAAALSPKEEKGSGLMSIMGSLKKIIFFRGREK
jgi:hypothetical protein